MTAHRMTPTPPIPTVVLLVFNRPEFTRRLLGCLRQVRPGRIRVVADGPRTSVPEDAAACREVRAVLEEEIDWDARVEFDLADSNLGLRRRVSSGLNWVFELEDRAIILEDDCLPHPTFFRFCAELLDHYADDTRIGSISGDNFQPPGSAGDGSYYFSRYPHCWGWCTWRRAWRSYDDSMKPWPRLRDAGWLNSMFSHPLEAAYWSDIFEGVYQRRINSWAYAWNFALWVQSQYTILPCANLVTNIGVGDSATHTRDADVAKHQLSTSPMTFPLVHPDVVLRNYPADDYSQRLHFGRAKDRSLKGRLKRVGQKCLKLPGRLAGGSNP